MKVVLIRLQEARDTLSQTEQSVADYLLEHAQEATDLSIHELSAQTFVSASTIVRLCRKLGFDGYKDLRKSLAYELAVSTHDLEEKRRQITRTDSLEDIAEIVTFRNAVSLEDTKALLDMETLQTCVDLVCRSRTVLLFGIGASLCAAQDAYLKFLRLNKPCAINSDWHSQHLQALNSSEHDLGIVISYSGQTVEVIECMRAMRQNKTPIIAITRCAPSPVSELADYRLYTASSESLFRSGAMSSRISQLNVIDILYTAFANSQYEESVEQLARTHIAKPASPPLSD